VRDSCCLLTKQFFLKISATDQSQSILRFFRCISFNNNNVVLCRAFIKSGTPATREPHLLCTGSGKRPDGVTQVPWSRGRCLAWYATCPDTFAVPHVLASSTRAGSAAATAEAMKSQKYADITTDVDFTSSRKSAADWQL